MDSSDIGQPAAEEAGHGSSGSPVRSQRLALIELTERDGRHVRLVDVHAWPVSVGRALDNDIVVDDVHVAARHALLQPGSDGRVVLQVLDTRNGVLLGRRRVPALHSEVLPQAGALLQLGATQLRLRLPGEDLPAEKPLPSLGRGGAAMPWLAGAGFLATELFGHWVGLDPGADWSAWLPTLVGLPAAVILWSAAWALLSKLFRHRFDFGGHLRIALPWLLAIGLVGSLWPQLTAMLSASGAWHLTSPLQALLLALMIRSHMTLALPMQPRTISWAVAACTLTAAGISLANTWRATDSLHNMPYMSTLPMPALRLAGTVPAATLVQDMAGLKPRLEQRVKQARDETRNDDGTDNDE